MSQLCETELWQRAALGWGTVSFPHSGWNGAVFRICAEHRDDNTEMEGAQEAGRRHSQES